MEPPVCLVNGETTLGERILGHGVIIARSISHQGETLETTVAVVHPGGIARGIGIIVETIAHVAPKWIENETMTRGGAPILARVVRLTGGRDHLAIIAEIAIIRTVSVEEWKRDVPLSCLSAPLCTTQRFDLYSIEHQTRVSAWIISVCTMMRFIQQYHVHKTLTTWCRSNLASSVALRSRLHPQ